ncbi:hypothetical protein B566_EDAN003597 [Ephemera danica]|nr:hypothetical protein B566_EDAN003597 [Ephemera danica]
MIAGVTRDVAGLVETLLGPLYPNFEHSRAVLVRQARDLLVCRFHGNLSQFEGSFLRPAAELLTSLRDAANTA